MCKNEQMLGYVAFRSGHDLLIRDAFINICVAIETGKVWCNL